MYHILYVDDESSLLEVGKLFLERDGTFIVDTITSPRDALSSLNNKAYDAIVSDYQMPGMNGIQFLLEFKKRYKGVPFILFTGKGREEVVIQAIDSGVDAYVQKGGDPRSQFAELSHKIKLTISRIRAETALEESEEKYRQFFKTIRDSVFITSPDGRWIDFNEALVEMCGYGSRKELSAVPVTSFYANPMHRADVLGSVERDGYVKEYPVQMKKKDGTILDILVTFAIQRNPDGTPRTYIGTLRDVTERNKAQKALEKSEEQYRRIVETTDEGIIQLDSDFNITYANRKMAEMHSTLPEEMIGHNLASFAVAEDIPDIISRKQERQQGKSGRYERRYLSKDGKIRWMQVSATPLRAPDGTFHGSFAMCSDVTDHKNAVAKLASRNEKLRAAYERLTATEEELRQNYEELAKSQDLLFESEHRYKNVVEDQTELICRFLPDGTHVFVNEAYCRYFGLLRANIVGHRFRPKIPTEDHPRIQQFFASLSPAHPVDNIEHRIIMPDGSVRWQWWSDRAVFDPNGDVTEYQSVGRDITNEKTTAEALRKNEIKFREQYQNNPLALVTWQHQDNDDFILIDCNKAALALTSGRAQALLKKAASDLYAARPDILSVFRHCFSGKTLTSVNIVSEHFLPGRLLHTTAAFVPPNLLMLHMDDITEQKEAEDALRESERKLADAMDLANLATWECDLKTGILTFDSRFSTLYSIDAQNKGITQMTAQDYLAKLVHPDDLHILAEEDEKTRTTNDPHYMSKREYRIIRSDGKVRYIEMCVGVIKDKKGQTIKTHGVNQDITEQKEAEDALRESERKLADAMDLANLATWECDLKTGILTFDSRFSTLYSIDAQNKGITQMTAQAYLAELVHPDDLHILAEEDEKTRTTNDPYYMSKREYRIIRSDGKVRYIEMCVGVIKDKKGQTIKTHGVNQDITEQKEAETALRESEEKFRSFVENANEILFSLTPDGKLTYVSPTWRELMGQDTREVIGKPTNEFIHPEDFPRNREFFREVIRTGKKKSGIEYRIRHKNGTWLWHTHSLSPVYDPKGRLVGVQGICHDITEQKKASDALRKANRQLGLLTGITRHDILNKVAALRGYLMLARMKYEDPDLGKYLQRMESATTAIQSQIEFTRLYQELGTLEPQWIELDPVMPRSQVPPTVVLDADIKGVTVFADPMLEKVFSNLLDNSIRHGGRVTELRVTTHISWGNLVIVWEDNGTGIAVDEKEHIFERGFGKNTGLGLFLVREVLSLTGITITETGKPGKSARFEILVPYGGYRTGKPD